MDIRTPTLPLALAATLALPLAGAEALAADNYAISRDTGSIITNSYGQCWHTTYWSPDDAVPPCDGAQARTARVMEAEPEPEPVAMVPPPPVAPRARITLDTATLFAFDSAELTEKGKAEIGQLASRVKGVDQVDAITVAGHTDSTGPSTYNERLSERRARAVREQLVSQGLDPGLIRVEAFGESRPVAPNSTPEGRAQNRRVTISVEAETTP